MQTVNSFPKIQDRAARTGALSVVNHHSDRRDDLFSLSDTDQFRVDRSLHHDVYAVIVDSIHRGKLRPGDQVSEAAIARQLGTSRGPVREAISRLDFEGLITRRPRRGAMVTQFTEKRIRDIAATRQLIEGYAARCACQRLTMDNIEVLTGLIDAMSVAATEKRWTETASLNARFHQTVLEIADNETLLRMWRSLHPLAWLLAQASAPFSEHDPASLTSRHRSLLDALQSGDGDHAERVFREHIAASTLSTLGLLPGRKEAMESATDAGLQPAAVRPRVR